MRLVVRVIYIEDGDFSFFEFVGRRKFGESFGEFLIVERRFILISGRRDDEYVLFLVKGFDNGIGNFIEDMEGSIDIMYFGLVNKLFGEFFGVIIVIGVENEKIGVVKGVEEGIVSFFGFFFVGSEKFGIGWGGYVRVDSGSGKGKLREVGLLVKEFGESGFDVRRVERELFFVRKWGILFEYGLLVIRNSLFGFMKLFKRVGVFIVGDSLVVFFFILR